MAKNSLGKRSFGMDDISGFKVRYTKLRRQWNGLKAAEPDFDYKHPSLDSVKIHADSEALKDPRPDRDNDNANPTQSAPSYPGFSTWGATTQLFQAITMTFGSAT